MKTAFSLLPFCDVDIRYRPVTHKQGVVGSSQEIFWKLSPLPFSLLSYHLKLGYDYSLGLENKDSRFQRAESWKTPEPEELSRTTIPASEDQNYLSTNFLHRNKIIT